MLSYRHAFHAGNHADVLKHIIQLAILDHLAQKPKPFWYIDTHAGAGIYSLFDRYAAQHKEFNTGVGRLWNEPDLPPVLHTYMQAVRALNPDGRLAFYPGSAWLAHHVMPKQSRLKLFELHPTDYAALSDCFVQLKSRAQVFACDGFSGLKTMLPPPPRRAFVLIDPPYEDKEDYMKVPSVVQQALKRFATGVYAVWYPKLSREVTRQLPAILKQLPVKQWLHATLSVKAPAPNGYGMHGSGMFVLNPPWTLRRLLEDVLPFLTNKLAQDNEADFTLEYQEN